MDFAQAVEQGADLMHNSSAFSTELAVLRDDAVRAFCDQGVDPDSLTLAYTGDARYAGQGFELRVPLDTDAATTDGAAHVAADSMACIPFAMVTPFRTKRSRSRPFG